MSWNLELKAEPDKEKARESLETIKPNVPGAVIDLINMMIYSQPDGHAISISTYGHIGGDPKQSCHIMVSSAPAAG